MYVGLIFEARTKSQYGHLGIIRFQNILSYIHCHKIYDCIKKILYNIENSCYKFIESNIVQLCDLKTMENDIVLRLKIKLKSLYTYLFLWFLCNWSFHPLFTIRELVRNVDKIDRKLIRSIYICGCAPSSASKGLFWMNVFVVIYSFCE